MLAYHFGDLGLVLTYFQQDRYLVSLFLGKLCVGSHECSFDLIIQEAFILPWLTSFFDRQSRACWLNLRDKINRYGWPEDAVRGLFAHELAHQVSYKRRSYIGGMLFVWNYPFSNSGKMNVEREADEIAIERGYGEDLIQARIYQLRIKDKKRLEVVKKAYLSPETLANMVSPNDEIIVYCHDENCPASVAAYQMLVGNRFSNLRRFAGGIAEWREAGYRREVDCC